MYNIENSTPVFLKFCVFKSDSDTLLQKCKIVNLFHHYLIFLLRTLGLCYCLFQSHKNNNLAKYSI